MALIYLANLEGKPDKPRADKFRTLHFPTGLGLMSGVLSNTDHEVRVVDNYVPDFTYEQALVELERNQPDYILFSGFLGNLQYGFVKKASRRIKELCPKSTLIIGGPMAAAIPEMLIRFATFDYVVIGEGEETLLDLLDALERGRSPDTVHGICYAPPNGEPRRTPVRHRMKDLTAHPFPRYELFDMDAYVSYLKRTGRSWEISTSRGCYARCSYCKLTFGSKITFRPVDHVVEEMAMIKRRFGVEKFNFVDDNFLNSVRQVEEMVAALHRSEEKFQFRFQGRADRIDGRLARLMKGAGCFDISYGLESGSQKILDDMKKTLDVKRAAKNLMEVLDSGIDMHATFIVGMPPEDEGTIAATKDFIRDVGVPNVSAGILTPFPDTVIYELAKSRGLIADDDAYCESLRVVYDDVYVNLTSFPDQQLRDWRRELNALGQHRAVYTSVEELVAARPDPSAPTAGPMAG